MQRIYEEVFAKAISEAGFKPHRVDQREYNDKIDDEIIVQIRRSRFIVADFTGHRVASTMKLDSQRDLAWKLYGHVEKIKCKISTLT